MTLDINIPKLVLDPANEGDLVQLAYARIQEASGNTITDFRAGSAAAAFVEGQTFALAELLYYMNLIPEAIAIEVFRLYGVNRSMGTKATGQLTVILSEFAVDTFILPAGYSLPYLDTEIEFLSPLVINPGSQEGTVNARVVAVGSQYNAKSFDITATSTGLALVQSVFNRLPFTGGSDIEPLTDLVARCQAATVSRSAIITQLDYENAAQNVLGAGSRAIAVPNLASDGIAFKQASVAVFMLDATGQPASLTTCQLVTSDLKTRVLLGTAVTCLPAVLVKVSVELNINVRSLSEEVALDVIGSIFRYLKPDTYDGGNVILHNEIAYQARLVDGVRSVDSVLLNGESIDLLLAQPWYYPMADFIIVNQIAPDGNFLTTVRSFAEAEFLGDDLD